MTKSTVSVNGGAMSKIDRGALMRRAWAIFRETYKYPQIKFADVGRKCFGCALGQAWAEARQAARTAATPAQERAAYRDAPGSHRSRFVHRPRVHVARDRCRLPPKEITGLINERFDRDFAVGAISAKAHKLGLIMPRGQRQRRLAVIKAPKLPPLTIVLRFPIGSLLDRINAVVPRHLARDHRDDVIGEMVLAVHEGLLEEADIERRVREFVNAGCRRDHDKYGPVSFDEPLFADSTVRLKDIITTGLWQ